MKEYYRKFKGVHLCTVVDILEGEGTGEFPMEQVGYVIKDGQLIGRFRYCEGKDIQNIIIPDKL